MSSSYRNWDSGQPDGEATENCLEVVHVYREHPHLSGYVWGDTGCEGTAFWGHVCQTPALLAEVPDDDEDEDTGLPDCGPGVATEWPPEGHSGSTILTLGAGGTMLTATEMACLTRVNGSLHIDNADLSSFSFDSLVSVRDALKVINNDELTHFAFPRLISAGWDINIRENAALTGFDMGAIESGGEFYIQDNPALCGSYLDDFEASLEYTGGGLHFAGGGC